MSAVRKTVPMACLALLDSLAARAGETNAMLFGASPVPAILPAPGFDPGVSVVRVFGALLLVLALFFGAVWLFRNWQRVLLKKQGGVRLNVVEVRSLGNKQSLMVVGYGAERLLLGATPAGISLLTHLPAEEAAEAPEAAETAARPAAAPGFMEALHRVVARKVR